jgi:CRISPR system Cascade subunit CasD
MASWGRIAVGEQRQTWTRPSRSSVLGLVAAALGHERSEQAAHTQLERGLGLALRVDQTGHPLRDYHTAQSPSQERNRVWRSRYDEIRNAGKLNTILSERSYMTEVSIVVALWLREGETAPTLAAIAQRLKHPTFTVYLGRKASPLGIPLVPVIKPASSLLEALEAFDAEESQRMERVLDKPWWFPDPRRSGGKRAEVWLAEEDARRVDHEVLERTQRRDSIGDRRTWTFGDRAEVRIALPESQP